MRPVDADAYADKLDEALMKTILKVNDGSVNHTVLLTAITFVKAVISDLRNKNITPTIDEVPKRTGLWLDTYNDGDWHCSECGAIVEKDEQLRHYWQRCYHCGANMINIKGFWS